LLDDRVAAGGITAGGDTGSATVFVFGGSMPPRFRWVVFTGATPRA
jgi:hypothetical protein